MLSSILSEFIPILSLFLLLSYPAIVASYSHSYLGKVVAIFIILFYSSIDKYLGLFVCGMVIFYYQLDYVEGFEMDTDNDVFCEQPEIIDDGIYLSEHVSTKHNINTSMPLSTRVDKHPDTKVDPEVAVENRINVDNNNDGANTELKTQFRSQYCSNNKLKYKNATIRNDMAPHVFGYLEFNKDTCNPCLSSCGFSIIESKMNTEEKMKPISTLP